MVLWFVHHAHARLPVNNRVREFWSDQSVAAEQFGLSPHVWSIVVAGLAVLVAAWVVRAGLRAPAGMALPAAPDLPPSQHRRWRWWLIGALTLFYAPGFFGDFNVYDDPGNIWRDPVVSELTWQNLSTVLFHNHRGVNQEWMILSLQLCHAVFGRVYAGYFAVNLALFPVLLWLVHQLAELLTRSRLIALVAVAFYGLSPIVAELLCWMLERGHYFGLLFALSSCVLYLRYLDVRDEPGRGRWRLLAGAVACYVGCQFGKPIFIFVPAWLFLFDAVRRRNDITRLVVEKVPFLVASGVFLHKILDAGSDRVRSELIGGSLSNTVALAANQTLEYLRASFVPAQTGIRTPWNAPASWLHVTGIPDILIHGFSPLASLVILLCLLAIGVTLAWRVRWPWLLLTGVGAVISFAPVANVPVHTVVQAYRYTHSANVLASITLAAAVVQLMAPGSPLRRHRTWAPLVFATMWLTLGAYHSNANRMAWSSSTALWTRSAYQLYPHDGWSAYYAGKSLQEEGRHREAIPLYHRSLRRIPRNKEVLRRLGDAHYALGQTDLAARFWRPFFSSRPRRIDRRYATRLREVGLADLIPDAVP